MSDNFGTEEASLIDFFDPEKVLAEQGTERDVYIYIDAVTHVAYLMLNNGS